MREFQMQKAKPQTQTKQLVIVDPKADDYNDLVDLVESGAIRWTITSTGASSLRLVNGHLDALWLISVKLPDMSGLDLLEMLRSMAPQLTIFVVDESYESQREFRALQHSAARYLCKPVQKDWITAWRGLAKSAPTSSPPPPKHLLSNPELGSYKPAHQ
jgi:CheY-like chemotaxis protein